MFEFFVQASAILIIVGSIAIGGFGAFRRRRNPSGAKETWYLSNAIDRDEIYK